MAGKKVLFIVPYPLRHAPSQRFRVELYEPAMRAHGIDYRIAPFMDVQTWNVLYRQGSAAQKAWGIIKGFLKRKATVLFTVPFYDYIFIHREAAPIGPPIYEWWIAKVWRKKIIYDFDDAIWIPNTSSENSLAAKLKAFWKVGRICKWAYKVAVGNAYLASFAGKHNANVVLLPTCVDMQRVHNQKKVHHGGPITIGWTGSHSTLGYLDSVLPILQKLQQQYDFTFLVIANRDPKLPLKNYRFLPWKEDTEINDLLQMDIGIMPLEADAWSEGKCGFKLIQYLSLGIPAVASPVGVNSIIIEEGVNGFKCATANEWEQALITLLQNPALRKRMGEAGHEKMLREYSIAAHEQTFLSLFQ